MERCTLHLICGGEKRHNQQSFKCQFEMRRGGLLYHVHRLVSYKHLPKPL